MSTNLYFRPYHPKPEGSCLSKALKRILAKKYWDHDGSLGGNEMVFTEKDVAYLTGLRDAATDDEVIRDVTLILEAIEKDGGAILWIEG